MAFSKIDIINRALTKIGQNRIASLDDDDERAVVAASIFDMVRDAELMAHSWSFAKRRTLLTPETTRPAWGWQYQFLIPPFCLRILEAGPWPHAAMGSPIISENRPFVIENNRILTNRTFKLDGGYYTKIIGGGDEETEFVQEKIPDGPALPILFIYQEKMTANYHPLFVEALCCKLAVEMCERITGDGSKREMAWKEYEQAVKTARLINALGLPPKAIQDGPLMLAHARGVI